MPVFGTANAVYTCLKATIDHVLAESPEALQGLLLSRLALRFKCTTPESEITLDGRQRPLRVFYGENLVRPDLDLDLAADTLHQILMDELSMKKAMGSGLIKVRGPAWKLKVLIDFVKAARLYYPAIARRHKLTH